MTMNAHRASAAAALAGLAGLALGIASSEVLQGQGAARPAVSGRRVIRPEKIPNTGLPYSPGIVVGNTLYLSGNLGRDPVTANLVRGGIEAETRQSLANIR